MPQRKIRASNQTIFVTGTDTCAGKTLLTGLILHHFRQTGLHALAMKPFCSGGRGDVELLSSLQDDELSPDEMNPFHFAEPIAPLVAARKHGREITLNEALSRVQRVKITCERLVIEGVGGVLVPLGEGYSVLDLMVRLGCPVVVGARNKLGVINHALLTVKVMQAVGIKTIAVVLMGCQNSDVSTRSNLRTLREMLAPIRVFSIPFLGEELSQADAVKNSYKKIKKTIALLSGFDNLRPFF
jgi:dethiobiotin synthase